MRMNSHSLFLSVILRNILQETISVKCFNTNILIVRGVLRPLRVRRLETINLHDGEPSGIKMNKQKIFAFAKLVGMVNRGSSDEDENGRLLDCIYDDPLIFNYAELKSHISIQMRVDSPMYHFLKGKCASSIRFDYPITKSHPTQLFRIHY